MNWIRSASVFLFLWGAWLAGAPVGSAAEFTLADLDLAAVEQDWGEPHLNRSVDNHPIFLDGQRYPDGLGTHANSRLRLRLDGQGESFRAVVGVDDEVDEKGSVVFQVVGDGQVRWQSGLQRGGQPASRASVDLAGIQTLELRVTDAGDGITLDHADWAEVRITMRTGRPVALKRPPEPQVILTPAAPVQPRLTGPRIVGTRTGVPFMHRLTATGERPLRFSARGLPAGLQLNAETGMLEGVISTDKTWRVQVTARNRHGAARQELRLVAGASPALTPPLGWNSWNAFGCEVDDAKIRAAADALAASGLADHGWVYINIDDCWQGERDAQGRIRSNARFPDLRALCDYLHARGFKAGVYSSPGPRTCASHPGSLGHEAADAQQYAEWGFDYLKYDWCSYGNLVPNATLDQLQAPYRLMRAALDAAPRNIVYSLCQYGQGKVSEWGRAVGGDSWRTTGDITDTWSSLGDIMRRQEGLERYAGPGAWNDMDMLVLGHVGWSAATRPTRLTPNEQYAHLSWWAMHCSPLLLGCDPARLDAFTVSLLSNDEVLEVNQDPLGRQAGPLPAPAPFQIRAKRMEDSSRVLGIFNFGEEPAALDLRGADLGLAKVKRIRDLWRQQDVKPALVTIPRHGVLLLRVW